MSQLGSTWQKIQQQIDDYQSQTGLHIKDYQQQVIDHHESHNLQSQSTKINTNIAESSQFISQENLHQQSQKIFASVNNYLLDTQPKEINLIKNINGHPYDKFNKRQEAKFIQFKNLHSKHPEQPPFKRIKESEIEKMKSQRLALEEKEREKKRRKIRVKDMNEGDYMMEDKQNGKQKIIEMSQEEIDYLQEELRETNKKWDQLDQFQQKETKASFKKMQEDLSEKINLTTQEILQIQQDMKDYKLLELFSKIDKYLIKLRFFQQTLSLKRQAIYNASNFRILNKHDIIYDSNSTSDKIYIIIKGNISLIKQTQSIRQIILSYSDGNYFNDSQIYQQVRKEHSNTKEELFNDQMQIFKKDINNQFHQNDNIYHQENLKIFNKKQQDFQFYVQSQSVSYVLEIDKITFQQIYFDIIDESGVQNYVLDLQNTPFFANFDQVQLMPLIIYLEQKVYAMNQVIKQQGSQPDGLFIITHGKVRRALVEQQKVVYIQKQKKSIANFTINQNNPYNSSKQNIYLLPQQRQNNDKPIQYDIHQLRKQYSQQRVDGDDNKHEKQVLCLVDLGDMEKGRMFGMKTILDQLRKEKDQSLYKQLNVEEQKSEISLIANNNDTRVLYLQKNLVHHLPEDLQDYLRVKLENLDDYDRLPVQQVKQRHRIWTMMKEQILQKQLIHNQNNRYDLHQIYKRF